jgi:uncharacterized membrane protein YvbJ
MKFCSKCGAEVMDEAVICTKCGCAVANNTETKKLTDTGVRKAGWYFGFLLGWIGVIIIVCLNNGKQRECDKFAVGGAIAWAATSIVFIIILYIGVLASLSSMPNYYY